MDNMENMDFETMRDKQAGELMQLLDERRMKELQLRLEDMNEFDVAEFLSEIGDNRMPMVFRLLSKQMAADVFANFDSPEQEQIINSITDSELSAIIEELYVDDAVDMMEELPANVVKRVMRTATPETRRLINQYLNYPENSAGSIMTAEFVDLKKYMNVRESIARIRRIGEDKETIYTCFVTSADRKLEGVLSVKDLLLSDDETVIEDIMDTNIVFCMTHDDQEEAAEKISDYDLMALPVVDKEGRLVGIVTVDDVIDVMEAEATEDFEIMAAMTPSDKPYSRTSAWDMWKRRVPWLIPMLMGTGGNSGAQASTAVIRSISLGDTEPEDVGRVIWKEFRVAILCGVTLAAVNFVKMLLVDRMLLNNDGVTLTVAAVVSLAIVFIVMFAKVVGSVLPIAAEKLGVDPAVMANPLISTITDAVSLLIYFEIAKLMISF